MGACVVQEEKEKETDGKSTCAPGLTWAKTADPFLEKYCSDCHTEETAELGGGHAFELEKELREHGHEMYELVESGEMPLDKRDVDEDDKADFLEWLECSGASKAGAGHSHD